MYKSIAAMLIVLALSAVPATGQSVSGLFEARVPGKTQTAPTSYSSYTTYASAPNEIIGKTSQGLRILTAEESKAVPAGQIVRRSTEFMQNSSGGQIYKVVFETVTPITAKQWQDEGSPTPKTVNRAPALEYYTYASMPTELLVRSPLGVWRKAKPSELTSVSESQITKRTQTFFIRNVGSSQNYKKSAGVTVAITDSQWRGEGSPTPAVNEVEVVGQNPFTGAEPYVDPTYPSVAAAAALRAAGDTASAAQIDKISAHSGSLWIGDWNTVATVRSTVAGYVSASQKTKQTGVLVLYGIPGRDCNGHSAGGFSADNYRKWVDQVALGIAGRQVAVIVEPDALLQLGRCPEIEGDRLGLLKYASGKVQGAGATTYLDAGSSYSVKPEEMSTRLLAAGVQNVRGFSTNVSNFKATEDVREYADEVSRLLGGKKYVIDTSRNGLGSNGEWCNARGRALGEIPGATSYKNQDANLWIKTVGRSDGVCNGGPAAGVWWNEIAIEMARNSTIEGTSESPTAMITVWNAGLPGCSNITLPIHGAVNVSVNWGDGVSERVGGRFPAHNYVDAAGVHTVTIDGTFESWGGDGGWKPACLVKVLKWGETGTTDASHGFDGATNLTSIAGFASTVTDMSWLLANTNGFTQDVAGWDLSRVQNLSHMFDNAVGFNRPLADWDVGSATDFSSMFEGATSFNQPVAGWDTGNATTMASMFKNATSFRQSVGGWNTANVRDFSSMFEGAIVFNQPLKTWNVAAATDMSKMFKLAPAFTQNLSTWNTSNVVTMASMFEGASVFNQPLATWNTSKVRDMSGMFYGAAAQDQGLSAWDVGQVTNMASMFRDSAINKNLSTWNTAGVKNMNRMFSGATRFTQSLVGWDVRSVTDHTEFGVPVERAPEWRG